MLKDEDDAEEMVPAGFSKLWERSNLSFSGSLRLTSIAQYTTKASIS
jgi:hypothetical protein